MNEITTRKIAADFNLLIDDVEELIKATADQTGERIVALRQRLEKKIEDTRKSLAEQACQFAGEAKASIESRLRQHPWSAVVVAAGIAFLLGLLLRRE
jgi:ElaB/YqjD/DUF883 family membrane-anchored ribosome-binding protein